MKTLFSQYYQRNHWKDPESRSGPGSTLEYTKNLRARLPELFDKFNINTVLDAPCGDFNWMKHVVENYDITYLGCDIVPEIVRDNQKYVTDKIQFSELDITCDKLPDADLMICRDCLFHFSEEYIWKFLNNLAQSNIKYLLTSSHINNTQNKNIKVGDFFTLNLFAFPYNFDRSGVLFSIDDWAGKYQPREMILVSRDYIKQVLDCRENFGTSEIDRLTNNTNENIKRKPTKAYILRIDTPISKEYAEICSRSCDAVGLAWEYVDGYQNMTGRAAWCKTGVKMKFHEEHKFIENPKSKEKAECCSAGHGLIWKKIAEGSDDAAIILEHDSIMLHPVDVDISDNQIVVLGYKIANPEKYDHKKAGPPTEIKSIKAHEGAHAYAITKKTAQILIEEVERKGLLGCIDNAYFLKNRKTSVPISITDPISALGWIRESTIWSRAASNNYEFIESFQRHYKQ